MALVDFKRWALSAISYGLPAVCLLAAQPGVAQSLDAKSEQAMLFAQIQAHPADHQSTLRYAVVSAARGDTEAAIGALEKLLVFNPGLTRVKFELGVLYARLGANETAIQYLRAAKAGGGLLVAQQAQIWTVDDHEILFLPRTDPMPDEPSAGIDRYLATIGKDKSVAALIYPDRRGSGYGLSRHNDNPLYDFTRIDKEPDVHFAHARGFVAKTSASEISRVKELLGLARV